MYSKKIYKKDSKGKIRVLHIYTKGDKLIQESGILDGALVKRESTCKSKNVGKANETTPQEQAVLEAKSKIKNKMTAGYFDTIEDAKDSKVILPMLAKDYNKVSVDFPVYVQPKIDGMRALYNSETGFISRKGKAIDTMGHIDEALKKLDKSITLDGELYIPGETFQENMRSIKKDRGDDTKRVKYFIYDMVSDKTFMKRLQDQRSAINSIEDISSIESVQTWFINNEEALKKIHSQFLLSGWEGTMIRQDNAGYVCNKRDSQLLKYKDFIDITCEVVDVLPSEKNPKQGIVHCKLDKDGETHTFGCGMKFSHTAREEILKNKEHYIGEIAEIRFFEYSEDGIPRFPVCHGFRIDK